MWDALLSAGSQTLQPGVVWAVVCALPVGLLFGLLPGLSGLTAMAVLIPFVYGMDGFAGLAFLLTAHAVVSTGGSVTAILLGIPGSPPNAATVVDGVPLRNAGFGGTAVGAALTASAVGGVFGALVLLVLLPVLRPVILMFGPAETFLLSLMGLTFLAAVGAGSPAKGLFAGAFGIFISFIGYEPVSGVPRYWFDYDYLLDGLRLIPLALGLFAIPELVALASGGSLEQSKGDLPGKQLFDGCKAVFSRMGLVLRSSAIGSIIGIIPGVGGETAPFVAYAAARQSDKNPERYGTGIIEGVIAPEASNNAKEGGALVPTLVFGVPGSSGMALLLGAFLVLGLQPGPNFLRDHLDIGLGLVLILAVVNVLAAGLMLALTPLLARVVNVPPRLLVPFLLTLALLGAYSTENNMQDVLFTFVFGAVGLACVRFGFNRAALLLGFVLGPAVERYLEIALNIYGPAFIVRPICLILIALMVIALAAPKLTARLRRRPA
ncbi:tripartite tricarboxylate transporter permease [Aurantimonas sp. MSK8Z-1]|uniref:tripartite tricarboxylate transporter permease n=1 Tax=Mangrovibrevibacter kandeliae TaxID=2968473 RepID=UPI0021190B6F|nr:tripartite tricarboxylate transporter permease [Aurantimonas sp. MSK8Z-1]MCW4115756.1 tripartite tricarboxylate transporter permease [Aurantimonas sp. MSK8Z-1]